MPGERTYLSTTFVTPGGVGKGWMLSDQPYISHISTTASFTVTVSPLESYRFELVDGVFQGDNGILESLSQSGNVISFVRTDGTVYQFNDFSFGADNALNGQLLGVYGVNGASQIVTATGGPENQISAMAWYTGSSPSSAGTSQAFQKENITYVGSGVNADRVASITLSGSYGGALVDMRRVDYTYYDGTTPYGFAGDLESATEYAFDAGGTPQLLGSSYYRYVNGHLSGALSPQGVANFGGLTAARAAYSSDLAPYEIAAFQYNAVSQVKMATTAVVGGLRNYTYTYGADIVLDFTSTVIWHVSCEELRPDGSTYTVYANLIGETMVGDLADTLGNHWVTVNEYNDNWQRILITAPSAVESYDPSSDTLAIALYAHRRADYGKRLCQRNVQRHFGHHAGQRGRLPSSDVAL